MLPISLLFVLLLAILADVFGVAVERQSNLAGYASFTFKDQDSCIYMSLSQGNNAISFRQVNNDKPIICPTKGTKGGELLKYRG
jgi:hypothetical protein